ncbi:MAG: phosphatidylglycerophosphate synthase [Candidatus Westeberhardia cardiocondylae]|nr:phosphatidylglycerophosphate synthase [Candidatus Westeberhardia cardiocondylae]
MTLLYKWLKIMKLNFPIVLTLFRIIIIPFFILTFYFTYQYSSIYCTTIFVLSSLTDWLDGFLSRKWNQTTKFGEFIDPIADKIMIITTLILIIEYFNSWYITLLSYIMIIREIVVSILRTCIIKFSNYNIKLISTKLSKLKTSFQMFSLIVLLYDKNIIVENIGVNLLFTATLLAFFSMLQYLYVIWKNIYNY